MAKRTKAGAAPQYEPPMEHVEPVVQPEEIPIGDSQPFTMENTQGQCNPPTNTQGQKEKLPVRRGSNSSSRVQTNCSGSATNPSHGSKDHDGANVSMDKSERAKKRKHHDGANVVQSSRVHSPLIVRGGVNYITMSNLGAYMGCSDKSQGTTGKGKASGSVKGDMPKSG